MSVNRDMCTVTLQVNNPIQSVSGAPVDMWTDVCNIDVAMYKTSDYITTGSARYNEASHTGLTLHKQLKEGRNRLKVEKTIYNIISCNTKPRLTNLLLKVVDDYARQ